MVKKLGVLYVLISFFITGIPAFAGNVLNLPLPGTAVRLSAAIAMPVIRGLKINPDNPFNIDFILDHGHSKLSDQGLKEESTRMVKYFLAMLTIPQQDLWVNLSPYEKERIVTNELGITELGKDMLAQDYLLKQLMASMTDPQTDLGKHFWQEVYQQVFERYGKTNVPVNTFNKVWIVPDKAVIFVNAEKVFIAQSSLRVMIDEDYLAVSKNIVSKGGRHDAITPSMLRQIILPLIEKEVNQGQNFAKVRQIYNALILAVWYKRNLKNSILNLSFSDRKKVMGIDISDKEVKEKIYQQYLKAFKKGVYNLIKEDIDPQHNQLIPRKYFSGGYDLTQALDIKITSGVSPAMIGGDTFSQIGFNLVGMQRNPGMVTVIKSLAKQLSAIPELLSHQQEDQARRVLAEALVAYQTVKSGEDALSTVLGSFLADIAVELGNRPLLFDRVNRMLNDFVRVHAKALEQEPGYLKLLQVLRETINLFILHLRISRSMEKEVTIDEKFEEMIRVEEEILRGVLDINTPILEQLSADITAARNRLDAVLGDKSAELEALEIRLASFKARLEDARAKKQAATVRSIESVIDGRRNAIANRYTASIQAIEQEIHNKNEERDQLNSENDTAAEEARKVRGLKAADMKDVIYRKDILTGFITRATERLVLKVQEINQLQEPEKVGAVAAGKIPSSEPAASVDVEFQEMLELVDINYLHQMVLSTAYTQGINDIVAAVITAINDDINPDIDRRPLIQEHLAAALGFSERSHFVDIVANDILTHFYLIDQEGMSDIEVLRQVIDTLVREKGESQRPVIEGIIKRIAGVQAMDLTNANDGQRIRTLRKMAGLDKDVVEVFIRKANQRPASDAKAQSNQDAVIGYLKQEAGLGESLVKIRLRQLGYHDPEQFNRPQEEAVEEAYEPQGTVELEVGGRQIRLANGQRFTYLIDGINQRIKSIAPGFHVTITDQGDFVKLVRRDEFKAELVNATPFKLPRGPQKGGEGWHEFQMELNRKKLAMSAGRLIAEHADLRTVFLSIYKDAVLKPFIVDAVRKTSALSVEVKSALDFIWDYFEGDIAYLRSKVTKSVLKLSLKDFHRVIDGKGKAWVQKYRIVQDNSVLRSTVVSADDLETYIAERQEDKAQASRQKQGGIDLTERMLHLETKNNAAMNVPLSQKALLNKDFDGLAPVIIKVTPIENMMQFLKA